MSGTLHVFPPAIPSKGGVALTLPAALQGVIRVFGISFMFAPSGERRARCRGFRKIFAGILALMLLFAAPLHAQSPFLDRKPVRSSDLSSVGYDERRQLLEIEFRSGGIYRYLEVPKETFSGLMDSESKGRYFATHIRDRFRHERLRPSSSAAK